MIHRAGKHFQSNVVAYLALFVALGGSAWAVAANSVGTKQLKDNAVSAKKIKKNAVRTPKIRDGAVSAAKLADGVVGATVRGFNYQTPASGTTATLFSLQGLTVTANCASGRVDARTSVDDAYISSVWVTPSDVSVGDADKDFDTTDTFLTNIGTGARTGSIEYVRPDGHRVSVSLQADMAVACTVSGHAFGSG